MSTTATSISLSIYCVDILDTNTIAIYILLFIFARNDAILFSANPLGLTSPTRDLEAMPNSLAERTVSSSACTLRSAQYLIPISSFAECVLASVVVLRNPS